MAQKFAKKQEVLETKLKKYCHDDESDEFMKSEVAKWLKDMDGKSKKLTSSDVQALDKRIEIGCKRIKKRQEEQAKGPSPHDVELPEERTSNAVIEETDDLPLTYLVYDTASNLQFQAEEKQRRRNIAAKKRELKEELDAQLAENAGKNDYLKRIEEKYAETVKSNYQAHLEQQEKQRAKQRETTKKLLNDRATQLEAINSRRQKESDRNIREERAMLDNAAAECKAEEKRQRDKVLEQKAFMERVIAENEENKRLIALKKIEAQREDQALQAANSERILQQERDRAATYARMKAKSEGNQQQFLQATAEATAKAQEDERRAIKFQQDKIKRDQEAHRREAIEREQEKVRLRKELAEQVADKKRREKEEHLARSEFSEMYRMEAIKAMEEDAEAVKKRRQAAVKNRQQLQMQMAEKQTRVDETSNSVMTEEEKKLNKSAIAKLVSQDKQCVEIIKKTLGQAELVNAMKQRRAQGIRGGAKDLEEDDEYF